jgi:hypothetical protein
MQKGFPVALPKRKYFTSVVEFFLFGMELREYPACPPYPPRRRRVALPHKKIALKGDFFFVIVDRLGFSSTHWYNEIRVINISL